MKVASQISGRSLFPVLLALFFALVTASLGIWQLARLQWKEELMHHVSLLPTKQAQSLDSGAHKPWQAVSGVGQPTQHVFIEMRRRHMVQLFSFGRQHLWVDVGYAGKNLAPFTQPLYIEGYMRPADKTPWWGTSVGNKTLYFGVDPVRLKETFGSATQEDIYVYHTGDVPAPLQPHTTLPTFPNNHRSYAITWFSLSLIFFGIAGRMGFMRFRKRRESGQSNV